MKRLELVDQVLLEVQRVRAFTDLVVTCYFIYDIAKQRLLNLNEYGYQTTTSVQDITDKTGIPFACVNILIR